MINMFRKVTNIIFISVLFLVTTGFSISFHYCCDNLVSMAVNSDATPCCPVENGCCDNETQHIQLEEDLTIPLSENIQKWDTEENLLVDILTSTEIIKNNHNVLTELSDLSPPGNLQENLARLQSFLL
jgi:hypothetical protein